MAKPRVFISSTYYDLKHIRASIEQFVESLGFDAILSERGDIAYLPDAPLDDSCYREAATADIFVVIIGGRYGSAASGENSQLDFDSITRREFEHAQNSNVPTFILIDSNVYAEYQTYLLNRNIESIEYAHVDSIGVFKFVEFSMSKNKNNPIFAFDRSTQITNWLRDQWAGLFRELLQAKSQQQQLLALSAQVNELKSLNGTLATYLEAVLGEINPEEASNIISKEHQRISEIKSRTDLMSNSFFSWLINRGLDHSEAINIIIEPNTPEEAIGALDQKFDPDTHLNVLIDSREAQSDYNKARKTLHLSPIKFHDISHLEANSNTNRKNLVTRSLFKTDNTSLDS